MESEKHNKLHKLIEEAINQLDVLIQNNKNIDHTNRYNSLLNYLNYCKEKAINNDEFHFEISNMGLKLIHYIDESIDSDEFCFAICAIDGYFFNEFLMI